MTKEEVIKLLETDYLSGNKDIKEIKTILGFDYRRSSDYVFKSLGIHKEFKQIQNKRRGLSAKKTCLEKYGIANGHTSEVKEKIKQRSLEKYGVENHWQAEEVKAKSRKTKLSRYGNANYTNRKKCLETMQTKYNVSNCSQLVSWKASVETTKQLRYGTSTYNNSDKAKQTRFEDISQFEIDYDCTNIQKLFSLCFVLIKFD